jgi:uncharacterized protein YoxC
MKEEGSPVDLSNIDLSLISDTFVKIILSLGAIFTAIYGTSKKFRAWINSKLKDTDTVKTIQQKCNEIEKKENKLKKEFDTKSSELSTLCIRVEKLCSTIEQQTDKIEQQIKTINKQIKKDEEVINKVDDKLEKDNSSTILTLKYEIQDICSRAKRYGVITSVDKQLLCELYHEYVDIWHENHYIKSEALKIIENFGVVDEYKR